MFVLSFRISARDRSGLKNAYFTGCIKTLMIDDRSINFDATNGDTLEQKDLAPCQACAGKPCGDHGACVPNGDDEFTCKCDEKYTGKFCNNKGKLFLYRSRT